MEKSNLKSQHVWPILLIGIGIIIVSGFSIFVFQGWAVVSSYGVEFPPVNLSFQDSALTKAQYQIGLIRYLFLPHLYPGLSEA